MEGLDLIVVIVVTRDKLLLGYVDSNKRVIIDSSFKDESDVWQIALGWPSTEEIEIAKASGDKICLFDVREHEENRSAAQNRLYWAWLTDLERTDVNEHAGKTKDEWADYFKLHSLSKIYERDFAWYAEVMQTLRNLWRDGMKEESETIHKFVIRETSTKDAKVKQFSEYLKYIENWAHHAGVLLRTDAKLYAEAMGL